MPGLLVYSKSDAINAAVHKVCAALGWEVHQHPSDALSSSDIACQGIDAALLDIDHATPETEELVLELTQSAPFFPIILTTTHTATASIEGSRVIYYLSIHCLEDLEHILISLVCAGFDQHGALARPSATRESLPRVLVVEDDVRLSAAVVQALRATEQFDVRAVHSGFQAGAVLPSFQPDVVIVDISLGDMDGRELCSFIRKQLTLTRTKVIGVSGYIPPSVIEGGGDAFDSFLEKPFRLKDLIDKVKACLA